MGKYQNYKIFEGKALKSFKDTFKIISKISFENPPKI